MAVHVSNDWVSTTCHTRPLRERHRHTPDHGTSPHCRCSWRLPPTSYCETNEQYVRLVMKPPAFHGTKLFASFHKRTRERYPDESDPRPKRLSPKDHFYTLHLWSRLPSGLFPSGFPHKIVYALYISHARYMSHLPRPSEFALLIFFDLICK
jgi:hypothetical protein